MPKIERTVVLPVASNSFGNVFLEMNSETIGSFSATEGLPMIPSTGIYL